MVIQTATDYRRAIDYLSTRNEIDTNRIGMMGLSLGALITFALSSIEPRIKTAIAGVAPILKLPELKAGEVSTFANYVNCDSFLMFMGNKDGLYTMDEAHVLFDRIPISQKEFVKYDTGHEPPAEYVKKVTDWFVKKLKS
jgi:cephalosporin-C deacetylase-like acetyl esterase